MTKYRRSALIASISFILLITSSLFLYSCGVSSPTGSQIGTNPILNSTKSGILSIPFASTNPLINITFSSIITEASSPVIISWAKYSQATSYNLYYSDTPYFANTKIINNITSPYTFQVENPEKNYYFFLTGIINSGEKRVSDEFLSFSKNNQRYNTTFHSNHNFLPSASQAFIPSGYVEESQYPQIPITGPLQITITEHNAIEKDEFVCSLAYRELNGNLYGIRTWAQYSNSQLNIFTTIEEGYASNVPYGSVDPNIYTITADKSTIIYTINDPHPGFYGFFGGIWDVPTNSYRAHTIVASMNGTSFQIATWPPSQAGDAQVNFNLIGEKQLKKLAKIDITPANLTTIYIHPKKPDAGKPDHGSQQYTAMGTFEGESVPVDVTKTGDVIWHSSKPDIATMSTKAGEEGLFVPVTTPKITLGTTDIQATSVTPAAPYDIKSNITQLNVACWEVTHIRQNKHVPNTEQPDWVNEPYGMDWGTVNMTNQKGKALASIYFGTRRVTPGPFNSLLGVPEYSIGGKGCHMVSANMVLTVATQSFSNPKIFNDWLADPTIMGFTPPPPQNANGIIWGVINNAYSAYISATGETMMEKAPDKDKNGNITNPGYTIADSYAKIDAALDKCNMVILRVNGIDGFAGHYVLIAGGRAGNYTIYDPWIREYRGDPDTRIDNLSLRYQLPPLNYNIITLK